MMARFSLGGDDDGVEERRSNNRPLPKRPRTSDCIVYTTRRPNYSAASASDSGGRAAAYSPGNPISTSRLPQSLLRREFEQEESDAIHDESEEQSEDEAAASFSGSSQEEFSEDEEEEEQQQSQRSGSEIQTAEARVNSTPAERGTARESMVTRGEIPTPVSVTLTDPDVLDCPICLEPLGPPVYQCENGHIACASCCIKMKNKCGSCCWPIGYNRCRAIEKVLESIKISCPYIHHGCKESINYSKKLNHEKTCIYTPCSCPHHGCNYAGPSKCLYTHFALRHSTSSIQFYFDITVGISLDNDQEHVFLQESKESVLFVLNRCIEPFGSCVSVICIAPSLSNKGFKYDVTAKDGESSIKLKTVVESTREWIREVPAKKCLLVPNDFMSLDGQLKLEVLIWRERA